jgi:hypothetical protein
MGSYLAIRKNEIMSLADKWMELAITMLSNVSQTENDKDHKLFLICGRWTQKINVYINTFMIIHTHTIIK